MHLQTKSWQKNSFGLFDYESKDIQKSIFKHQGTGKLLRQERKVRNLYNRMEENLS